MSKKVFVYRVTTDNRDRDAVAYFELRDLNRAINEGNMKYLGVCGPAYSGGFTDSDYSEVATILTQEQFEGLQARTLTTAQLMIVRDKLLSQEAAEFFAAIVEEEVERVEEEYGIDADEVQELFDNSPYGYTDFGLISCVYDDAADAAEQLSDDVGNIPDHLKNYVDYDRMGQDMVNDGEQYVELRNGRVVYLNL